MAGDPKGRSARDELLAGGFCRAEELVVRPHSDPSCSRTAHLRAQYNIWVRCWGFFFSSLAIGTTLTRLKGSCVRVHLGRWGKLTVRHLIFISGGSTHFNTYHSLFRWIQQQCECVLLLGFLGDHSMQWCLLFSQGKAVAFATKSVALFTATESSFRGGGWSSSFTAYTWEKSNATTARQVLSKGKNPNKSCLHWQWQDLPAYMAFSSYSCTARSPLACLQEKTRSLSIYSKYRLSQLTFRTKKKE